MCDQDRATASSPNVRHLSLCAKSSSSATNRCNVLLVEPAMVPQSDRERLLTSANYCVITAVDVREMYFLRLEGPMQFAILHDSLGSFALRAAAESARQQWPEAKIVIIGCAVPALEDHLYDEAFSRREEAASLLDVLEELTKGYSAQTALHTYEKARRYAVALRESDPTKRPKAGLAEHSRDLPGDLRHFRTAG